MQTSKAYFTQLYIVYISVIVVMFLLLAFSYLTTTAVDFSDEDIPYLVTNIIIIIVAYVVAFISSKNKIEKAKVKRGLREKLMGYRQALFTSWGILSIAIVCSLACHFMRSELIFISTTLFSLVLFALQTPTLAKMAHEMDLGDDEVSILANPKSAI